MTYPEAAQIVAEAAGLLFPTNTRTEHVDLLTAQGRVLASELRADRDQPPFPRSTRDGFACQSSVINSGRPVQVVGQLRAGDPISSRPLQAGECLEIMTGAPVPEGADCVAMVEHVIEERLGEEAAPAITLQSGRTLRSGENIVQPGSEARAGSVILPTGTRLYPAQIAAAASIGAAELAVFAQPRVAILATGDELVEVAQTPLPHQIRNSNSYSLAAAVRAAGGVAVRLPVAQDELGSLTKGLIEAEARAELLLLSGGVSMGKYDLVERALSERGAEFLFTGVQMQPGKPVVFGTVPGPEPGRRLPFFGLPGNPVSTMVTFELFVAPLLRALSGEAGAVPRFAQAQLTQELRTRTGLTRFLPARLEGAWDGAHVTQVAWQGSGDLAATARANCFLVIPPDRELLAVGSSVTVLLT